MKRKVLGLIAVLALASLTACGNKQEVNPAPQVNNNSVVENVSQVPQNVTPQKSELDIAKASLIDGGEWKPTTAYFQASGDEMIDELSITDVYGKYAGVGGATFHEDGTFTKFVGIFDGEEEEDKTGTYQIDAENHTITFKFSRGEEVKVEYDYENDGKVMYFMYPEGNYSVRFDPTNEISLKNNNTEAKYQIELAMKNQIKEAYGDEVVDSKIYVEKIYSPSDEEKIEALKEMNLGENEIAFEVKYELKPAEGVDVLKFTAATGDYDEESGWVKEKYNLGILRPNEGGNTKYKITDFGTGW